MKKYLYGFLILVFLSLIFSCYGYGSWNVFEEDNNVNNRTKSILKISEENDEEFASAKVASLKGKYDVLIVSDVHCGSRKDSSDLDDALLNWLDSVRGTPHAPVFAICLGDATDLGTQDDFDEYLEFCNTLVQKYDIKIVFNACGNHDIYQSHWANWEKYCYPHTSFYSFKTSGFSWYAFDTASGVVGKQQYEILEKELLSDPNPKIVYSHYPLSAFRPIGGGLNDSAERNLLINAFTTNNVKCYFGGHNHYIRYADLGFHDYCVSSYRYKKSWMVLHVDEDNGTAYADVME